MILTRMKKKNVAEFVLSRCSLVLWAVLSVSCASAPAPLAIVTAPSDYGGAEKSILVVTSRSPVDDDTQRYGSGRSKELHFDDISVWIPPDRERGSVPYPDSRIDPQTDFGITQIDPITKEIFLSKVKDRLSVRSGIEKFIFLYVHGYNNPYSHGVYRQAQIYNDFEVEGVAVHYSWPSAGRFTQYMYDRDSAQFARDGLVQLIKTLSETDATSVMVMGHSMGALVAMEAIRSLAIANDFETIEKISPLMLASPDIDVDVFSTQLSLLEAKPEPFVVFASRQDKALTFSKRLRGGHPRVGGAENISELEAAGVIVVDLSSVDDGDNANHATFASSPTLIRMLTDAKATAKSILEADNAERRDAPLRLQDELITDMITAPKTIRDSLSDDDATGSSSPNTSK
ncbi:MAG: alpha/beta fold hydrolase [Pseudomonadota bacterium]